jgi:hypothetical protein
MKNSLNKLYAKLKKLNQVDPVTSAQYREQAQEILATPSIALKIRKAIADRLNRANQQLTLKNVNNDESY